MSNKECKCPECEIEDCVARHLMKVTEIEQFSAALNKIVDDMFPDLSIQNLIRVKSQEIEQDRIKFEFWKNILEEENDKELIETAIETLQNMSCEGTNVIEEIRTREDLQHIHEKCKKLKIKGFN